MLICKYNQNLIKQQVEQVVMLPTPQNDVGRLMGTSDQVMLFLICRQAQVSRLGCGQGVVHIQGQQHISCTTLLH